MDNCPRCLMNLAYGCSCSLVELSQWQAEEINRLRGALIEIERLEETSYSMRQADDNFKKCGIIARDTLTAMESSNG